MEKDRDVSSAPVLALTRVKAIAQRDESIGKMGVEATSLIARCTEAFLADLVRASVDRARAAGHREPSKKVRKRPAASTSAPQQLLPEDVRKAVAKEERFDFLRPVLAPQQKKGGEPPNTAGTKGKRKRGPASGRAALATGGGGARKGKRRMGEEAAGAVSGSDLLASGGAAATMAGAGVGDFLALAGLDDAGRRRALLGGAGSEPPPAAAEFFDDEDEDYDNL